MTESQLQHSVALLFENLDGGSEVRTYLKQFRSAKNGFFAVIKVGGGVLDQDLDLLAQRLVLLKSLGLSPIVVYGAGNQLDQRLKREGHVTERKDNLRVTPPEVMTVLAQEVDRVGLDLVGAIGASGGQAMLMPKSFVQASCIDFESYGLVGTATGIHREQLEQIASSQLIPLVSCVAQGENGRLLNVNADSVAKSVAKIVNPQKVIFLTPTGGLLDQNDNIIDSINLASEFDRLEEAEWLHSGMLLKIREIKELLDVLPMRSSASITSPRNLIRELFTHGGDGTLVRRGERIQRGRDFRQANLTALFESAFNRELKDCYWPDKTTSHAIYTEHYRAAALVTSQDEFDILDKFAVHDEARGEGLAKAVWRELALAYPKLIWRSRLSNPINTFYTSNADGFLKLGQWLVLWYGHEVETSLIDAAKKLAARPSDFVE